MKLVLVTSVEEFQEGILKLFKKANIENFSTSGIDGYKNRAAILHTSHWFSGQKSGTESKMFFSFTDEEHIDTLFGLIKEFNETLETNNPVRAIVVPIEKWI